MLQGNASIEQIMYAQKTVSKNSDEISSIAISTHNNIKVVLQFRKYDKCIEETPSKLLFKLNQNTLVALSGRMFDCLAIRRKIISDFEDYYSSKGINMDAKLVASNIADYFHVISLSYHRPLIVNALVTDDKINHSSQKYLIYRVDLVSGVTASLFSCIGHLDDKVSEWFENSRNASKPVFPYKRINYLNGLFLLNKLVGHRKLDLLFSVCVAIESLRPHDTKNLVQNDLMSSENNLQNVFENIYILLQDNIGIHELSNYSISLAVYDGTINRIYE